MAARGRSQFSLYVQYNLSYPAPQLSRTLSQPAPLLSPGSFPINLMFTTPHLTGTSLNRYPASLGMQKRKSTVFHPHLSGGALAFDLDRRKQTRLLLR